MPLQPDQSELIGASMESVAYGVFLTLFAATVYVLRARKQSHEGRTNKALLVGASVLFSLITSHWIIDQLRLWAAFIEAQGLSHGANLFYGMLGDRRNVIRNFIWMVEIIMMDSMLIYRLYVIWGHDYRILILPLLTLIGTVVCVTALCSGFVNVPPEASLWDLPLSKWIIASFSLSLATNVLVLALIAGGILLRERRFRSAGAGSLKPIITITVESASLYCIVNLIILVTVAANSALNFTFRNMASPVTGISFCLITLRVGLARSLGKPNKNRTGSSNTSRSLPASPPIIPMHVRITYEREFNITEDVGVSGPASGLDQKGCSRQETAVV